jgi:hypothetical protein
MILTLQEPAVTDDRKPLSSRRELIEDLIMALVGIVWAISFLLDPWLENYSPRPEIGFALTAVIGLMAGRRILRKKGDAPGSSNEEDDD